MAALRRLGSTLTTDPTVSKAYAGAWLTCLVQVVAPHTLITVSIMEPIGSLKILASMTLCQIRLS